MEIRKGLCKRKAFVRKKGGFQVQLERFSTKKKRFCFEEKAAFSVHAKPSIKKSFF